MMIPVNHLHFLLTRKFQIGMRSCISCRSILGSSLFNTMKPGETYCWENEKDGRCRPVITMVFGCELTWGSFRERFSITISVQLMDTRGSTYSTWSRLTTCQSSISCQIAANRIALSLPSQLITTSTTRGTPLCISCVSRMDRWFHTKRSGELLLSWRCDLTWIPYWESGRTLST